MPKFLVKGRIKPGRKADLASRMQGESLAKGSPHQEELLSALRDGHAVRDEVYFMLEAEDESLDEKRAVVEGYFAILTVLPVGDVADEDLVRIEGEDALPHWAGVDDDEPQPFKNRS